MSAERNPQHEFSLLARPLGAATRLVLRSPKVVIAAALILAALSILSAVQFLGFKTSRLDLLNPKSGFNQRWLAYVDEFGDQDDAVIVVEGAGRELVAPVVEELAAELSREPQRFRDLLYKRDLAKLRTKGLHFLPDVGLQRLSDYVSQLEPVVRGDWEQLSVGRAVEGAAQCLAEGDAVPAEMKQAATENLLRTLVGLGPALSESPESQPQMGEFAEAANRLRELDTDYLLSNEGRLGFVLLHLPPSEGQFAGGSENVDRLRAIIKGVQGRHPEVKLGLTGMPILENDEMRASQSDMLQATLLSLVGVAILFVAGFGGWRHSVFAVTALLISMAWSFGFITLVIGHLNILSSAFAAILIGLGIDFGIHFVARYLQLRRTVGDSASAIEQTATSVGPGIITGGVTTAVAFGTTAMTDFVGVAELGIVAAGGLLLCIAGALTVLPAMIYLSDRQRPGQQAPGLVPFEWLLRPILAYPKTVLAVTTVVAVVVSAGAVRLRYDHNLLNLQPTRTESVEVERRLHTASDRSVFFAVSMVNSRQELRERKARFEKLETVERTEEIASLVPESSPAKSRQIDDIRRRLAAVPETAPALPVVPLERLVGALERLAASIPATGDSAQLRTLVVGARDRLQTMPAAEAQAKMAEYQRRTVAGVHEQLRLIASISNPQAPTLSDVPAPLAARFVGQHKKHSLRVYAKGNVWEMPNLTAFVRDVESVDPQVTGHPVQTFYASRQMQQSFIQAALYSLIVVAIVVMLDFRSIRYSLLSLLPMGLGLLLMFGVLGLLDIPLNPANLIALPLVLGMGLDDGVHLVHEYQRQKGRFRLTSSTATAVLLTSLTTMVGFGVMVFARHQGIRSLGQSLTIGMFTCLFTSIVMLPALLAIMSWNRKAEGGEEEKVIEQESPAENVVATAEPSAADEPPVRIDEPQSAVPPPSDSTLRTSRILARRRRRPQAN